MLQGRLSIGRAVPGREASFAVRISTHIVKGCGVHLVSKGRQEAARQPFFILLCGECAAHCEAQGNVL